MAETQFLNENGVSVSNSRFVTGGETFALNGITSVGCYKKSPSRIGPIVVAVIGVVNLFMFHNTEGGLIFLAIAAAWFIIPKPRFSVLLHTAAGQTMALSSKDRSFIDRVVAALNDAIVARG